jgi:aminoglycoside phosphotransferase (APT) family kinase protein
VTDQLSASELAGVAAVMTRAGVEPAGPLESTLIAGGRSNLTFRLSDGVGAWVLRTPPRAGRTPSAHDVAREHRVTSALGPTPVPVPPAVLLHAEEDVLGGSFAISEFVEGVAIQSASELDRLDDETLAQVVRGLTEALAALHDVDHEAVGLGRFGRPDAYAERQLKRWAGQWDLVGDRSLDGLAREVSGALEKRLPDQRSTGIVHGDFRIDNTLLDLADPGRPRVAAVVDWELSTIGDPVADVATMIAYRNPAFDLIVGETSAWTSLRLPDAAGLSTLYESAGGVRLVDLDLHLVLAHYKIAVIAAGIDHRRRAGSGGGAGFDTAGRAVAPYLEAAHDVLRRGAPA